MITCDRQGLAPVLSEMIAEQHGEVLELRDVFNRKLQPIQAAILHRDRPTPKPIVSVGYGRDCCITSWSMSAL